MWPFLESSCPHNPVLSPMTPAPRTLAKDRAAPIVTPIPKRPLRPPPAPPPPARVGERKVCLVNLGKEATGQREGEPGKEEKC